jgi:hypothetical protein
MLGLNVQCCDYKPPPPAGVPQVTDLTPRKLPPIALTPPKRKVALIPGSSCGPDVTDAVLDILKDMKKDYDGLNAKNPAAATKACDNLTSLSTGANAWDITGLDPSTSPQEGQEVHPDGLAYTDKLKKIKLYPWLTEISNACAIPRPQCAATVEFMGRCVHPQKLNYIQWGAMKKLCDGGIGFNFAKSAYDTLKRASGNLSLEENATADVGEAYIDALGNNANPDLSEIKKKWHKKYEGGLFTDEQACKLGCPLTDAMKKKIKEKLHGYKWAGIPGHQSNN